MKRSRMVFGFLSALLLLVGTAHAQEKSKEEPSAALTPLKIQLVLAEYEHEKKISSLPYTLQVNAYEDGRKHWTFLRMGVRVPVALGSKDGSQNSQYIDVGTNIDCAAERRADGRFQVNLNAERSSLVARAADKPAAEWSPGDPMPSSLPILRQMKSSFTLLLADGQTAQATVAADPISGHVLKIDVSLSVLK